MNPQTFLLSWPPSVNDIWRAVKGRNILSGRYRLWRDTAAKELMIQRPVPFSWQVSILIELCPPDNRAYDLDNRVKAIFDLLVHNHVITSDSHKIVREFTVRVGEGFTGARVTVSPFLPVAPPQQAQEGG